MRGKSGYRLAAVAAMTCEICVPRERITRSAHVLTDNCCARQWLRHPMVCARPVRKQIAESLGHVETVDGIGRVRYERRVETRPTATLAGESCNLVRLAPLVPAGARGVPRALDTGFTARFPALESDLIGDRTA